MEKRLIKLPGKLPSKLLYSFLLDINAYLDYKIYNYCILTFDTFIHCGTVSKPYVQHRLTSRYITNTKIYKIRYYESKK
jgi:hypothetical protein